MKKFWILGIVIMVLFGSTMTSCDNGTTDPDDGRVVEEKYRGVWVLKSDETYNFELFETTLYSLQGYTGYIYSDFSHVCTINNELWMFYTNYPDADEYWTLDSKLGTFTDDNTFVIYDPGAPPDRIFIRKITP
jgi:hypothetical protein